MAVRGGMVDRASTFDPEFLNISEWFGSLAAVIASPLRFENWPSLELMSEWLKPQNGDSFSGLDCVPVKKRPRRRRNENPAPIDFDSLYDVLIAKHHSIPCYTESYHDLFNALIFRSFPLSKRALHARQCAAIYRWIPEGAYQLPNRRLREQDSLTVFDEGGSILLLGPDEELTSEMLRPWTASEGGGRMILFGHALLEHLYFKRGQVMTGAIILRDESFIQTAEIDPRRIDSLLEKRLKNAAEFLEPKADQTVKLDSAGAGWFL